ncbi:polysaccharide deacetylase [Lucifera butyrica]|uniref:Polysaccharide deacetylase n=1 Tax=Lucifera butyrica TaxID=1351585 RepID=A0A498RKZ9_9FIRM|nr:polysaccharide deacetylase family protein [Lucifera butyrica]VBB09738.1 polysaccharide deacetylase [Lucifera butyrica]
MKTKQHFILILLAAVVIIAAISLFLLIGIRPEGIPVLNYHEVVKNDEDNPLALSVKEFDEQMAYLHRNGYKAITPDELLAYIGQGRQLPAKSVLITFDDGYRDNYTNAFPVLKKYGFTATIFLITDFVGNDDWYLNWQQVREMQRAGIVFGSHTLNHIPLVGVPPAEVLFQLQKSKEGIEWRLGVPVNYLAYPTGAYDAQVCQLVRQAGYKAAFSVDFGRVTQASKVYALERVPIFKSRWSFYDFYLRLNYTSLIEKAKWVKQWLSQI